MEKYKNSIKLSGIIVGEAAYAHAVLDEKMYSAKLSVSRLSGAEDLLPITISDRLMPANELVAGTTLTVEGQLRSYNVITDGASRLLLTTFVQNMLEKSEENALNDVSLMGALCKEPLYRMTPFGREIADLMLAVNRPHGKSDYIPCIAWGRTARFASNLSVGDTVEVFGRFQSRPYQKQQTDGKTEHKIAYEVSISKLLLLHAEDSQPRAGHQNKNAQELRRYNDAI